MKLGFFKFLLSHCSTVDAVKIFWSARYPAASRNHLRIVFSTPNKDLVLNFRSGTTDLEVFFEIFYALVYPIDEGASPEIIVDLGANIGLASLFFATRFPQARIFAFEPVRENYDIARNHLTVNRLKNVQIYHLGVADFSGNKTISTTRIGRFGDYSLTTGTAGNETMADFLDAKNLFDFLQIPKIDILKIDIEGAEHLVLPSLESDLRKIGDIVGELHGDQIQVEQTVCLLEKTHRLTSQNRDGANCFHFQAQRRGDAATKAVAD